VTPSGGGSGRSSVLGQVQNSDFLNLILGRGGANVGMASYRGVQALVVQTC
jgi:hypothetical protein